MTDSISHSEKMGKHDFAMNPFFSVDTCITNIIY